MRKLESLYRILFSLPDPRVSALISTLLALILGILDLRFLYLWILINLSCFFGNKLIGLKFDVKRTFSLSIILVILSIPSILIFGTPSSSYFLFLSVLYFCSESGILRSSVLSLFPYILVDPSVTTVLVIFVSVLLLSLFLKILNKKVGVVNIRDFVESFILFWLTSEPRYMEKFFLNSSDNSVGKVRCISIGSAKLVSTDFHPGPFRNVGGALLVKKLYENGLIYLHSPTSHSKNPVAAFEVERIKSCIRCEDYKLKPMKPFKIEGKKFEVFCFPFDKIKLIFVSGKNAIDDFEVKSGSFVVDCHNAHVPGFNASSEVGEIENLIKIAETKESFETNLKHSFFKLDVSTRSICNYISALLLDYSGERYALIIFDSNNIKLEFRKRVEREVRKIGYIPIVLSTDNHEKTGIRVKESYRPAGSCEEDWEAFRKILHKLKSPKFSESKCSYGESEVRIRTMSKRLIEDSKLATNDAGKFIATFLALALLDYLLPGLTLTLGW